MLVQMPPSNGRFPSTLDAVWRLAFSEALFAPTRIHLVANIDDRSPIASTRLAWRRVWTAADLNSTVPVVRCRTWALDKRQTSVGGEHSVVRIILVSNIGTAVDEGGGNSTPKRNANTNAIDAHSVPTASNLKLSLFETIIALTAMDCPQRIPQTLATASSTHTTQQRRPEPRSRQCLKHQT